MVAKEISSSQHPLVKYFIKLREEKAFRHREKKVLIMGKKMVEELCQKEPLEILLLEKGSKKELPAKETLYLSKSLFKKITALPSPESICGIVKLPLPSSMEKKNYLLVLDGVADPGNLGTLFRSALGLGWEGVILTPTSVDPFNDKALRSAKGATFFMPYSFMKKEEILSFFKKKKVTAYIAHIKGKEVQKVHLKKPLALILSKESGIDFTFAKNFSKIALPMRNEIDSFNVAVSGSILLYLLGPLI